MTPHLESLVDRLVAEGHERLPRRRPSWISESDWQALRAQARLSFQRRRVWLLLSIPVADRGWLTELTVRSGLGKTALCVTALRVCAALLGIPMGVSRRDWLNQRRVGLHPDELLNGYPPLLLARSELQEICYHLSADYRGSGSASDAVRRGMSRSQVLCEVRDHIIGLMSIPGSAERHEALRTVMEYVVGLIDSEVGKDTT